MYPSASMASSRSWSPTYADMSASAYREASSNIEAFKAWNPARVMNWNRYPMAPSSFWNRAMVVSSRWRFQLNDGEQL